MNINTNDIEQVLNMVKEGKEASVIKNAIFDLNKKAGYNPEYDPKVKEIISELATTKGTLNDLGGMDEIKKKLELAKKYEKENMTKEERLVAISTENENLKRDKDAQDKALKEYNDTLIATINNELAGIPDDQREDVKKLVEEVGITKRLALIQKIKQMAKITNIKADPGTPFGDKADDLSLKNADPVKWQLIKRDWVDKKGYPEDLVKQWFLGKIPALPTQPPKK